MKVQNSIHNDQKVVIIGAGPAGLTAAIELLEKTSFTPILLEADQQVGGISKTYNYKGNRMDIGGHRFFSKSNRVMEWWLKYLPLEKVDAHQDYLLKYQGKSLYLSQPAENSNGDHYQDGKVMLVRNRLSRIFYLRKFFQYPLSLNKETIKNLGILRMTKIGWSYILASLFPYKEEKTLEQFFINRFGRQLYLTFFKDYTEKVWGVPCSQISAEWGAQRIKGLNIGKAIKHALRKPQIEDINQKHVETSLIERFLYPKFGPGQLWEIVADEILNKGGCIYFNSKVVKIEHSDNQIKAVYYESGIGKEILKVEGHYFFSTMPIKDFINAMIPKPPDDICTIANGLLYRDFITVGLLVKQIRLNDKGSLEDNWIYIQEKDVKIGRLQVFNNWSPYMVANPEYTWLGLEYFCQEEDQLWQMNDDELKAFASSEMVKLGFFNSDDVLDGCVLKVPKTYPAYFGSYDRFSEIISYLDSFENLYCIGRNGMHRYNNQDHSMLTAMLAVENIVNGCSDKKNIWSVNTEQDYHEEK